jgi:hypothetical protein
MSPLQPHLEILPPSQRVLWHELHATPDHFTLYGGTGLALHLGHRESVDFDFFSRMAFGPDELMRSIPYLAGAELISVAKNSLTCRLRRDGWVKMQFFGGLPIGTLEPRMPVAGAGFSVASLIDLAAAQVKVLPERAEEKDYIDIAALLAHGLDLPAMLGAAGAVYGTGFNPVLSVKALTYFDDLPHLADGLRGRLRAAALGVDLGRLPVFKPFMAAIVKDRAP